MRQRSGPGFIRRVFAPYAVSLNRAKRWIEVLKERYADDLQVGEEIILIGPPNELMAVGGQE